MSYSKKTWRNFLRPKNLGEMKNPDSIGQVGNPVCGDIMEAHLKVRRGKIKEIKFKTFGCAAAIASSSIVTQLAKGKTIEEAEKIDFKKVIKELNGLPPVKVHCSSMASEALKKAIKNYKNKK